MRDDELQFLQQQLEATELLPCATCQQQTLHAHVEVLARYAGNGVFDGMHCLRHSSRLDASGNAGIDALGQLIAGRNVDGFLVAYREAELP